jgi:hypothetical protein
MWSAPTIGSCLRSLMPCAARWRRLRPGHLVQGLAPAGGRRRDRRGECAGRARNIFSGVARGVIDAGAVEPGATGIGLDVERIGGPAPHDARERQREN